MTAIVEFDPIGADGLRGALGPEASVISDLEALRHHLDASPDVDAVVLGPSVDQDMAFDLADRMRVVRPTLGVVLVRRRLDAAVLTEALRAGVREVVQDRDLAGLTEAVARARDLAKALRGQAGEAAAPDARRARVVTVFSAKGGCGKTTLATNLAAYLADSGRSVALFDLDLAFGDVAIALQLFPTHSVADAVPLEDTLDGAALASLLTAHRSGLQALTAPLEPGAAEKVPTSLVTRIIDLLAADFEYVIIDTPPALDDHVLSAFDKSDVVALMATLDIPALKNLKLTLETLDLIAYPRDRLKVVLNRADSKVGLTLGEVEKTLRTEISSQIPSSREVPASTNRGVALVSDDPKHPVSLAVRQFAESFVLVTSPDVQIPAEMRSDRRGGLLRRRKG
jgi:pilus assembly protein CpaE